MSGFRVVLLIGVTLVGCAESPTTANLQPTTAVKTTTAKSTSAVRSMAVQSTAVTFESFSCGVDASCGLGFTFEGIQYNVVCTEVKEHAVGAVVLATGNLNGAWVQVRPLISVDPKLLVGVQAPGGHACGASTWVSALAFPGPDPAASQRAFCHVLVLTPHDRAVQNCP